MGRYAMENPDDRKREQVSVWCSKEWHDKIMNYAMKSCKSASTVMLEAIQDKIRDIKIEECRVKNAIHESLKEKKM